MIVEIIAKYLESNKRLVVPNLGTFIVKVAGESVLFSALIKSDDGILRKLVAQQGMSEVEAAGVVDRFVFEVNYRLQNDKKCPLKGLGLLVAGDSGVVTFKYDSAIDGENLDGVVERAKPEQKVETPVVEEVAKPAEEPVHEVAKEEKAEQEVSEPAEVSRPVRQRDNIGDARVSVSAKMRPESYVKGLRYGNGRKGASSRDYGTSRRSNKSDIIMKIAIGAAVIATLALGYGLYNDWRNSRFDSDYIDNEQIYEQVPESAEGGVRNPDLDYITPKEK
ncbi:MAG: hypothetical protein IKY82_00860 [Alistipes sp.]|nr:hypothetical protein [Alistipes sp.]